LNVKDTFVIVAGQGNKSGEHFFYLELRNSKLKILRREAMQLINQLANNLKSRIGKCFGIIFSTKRSEIRAITELINRYRKEPFWTQTINSARCPNRHDLDCNCFTWFAHFAALLSREMDEPLRFIGSMAMILLFWSAR
jgi:hypothetical protein